SARAEGNDVFITLGGSNAQPTLPEPIVPAASARSEAAATPARNGALPRTRAIESIDFRRGEAGEGRVVVQLTDPRTVVDLKQEGGQIVLEFKDVRVPDAVLQRYDVTDFATPVSTIDATRRGDDA